MYKSQTLDPHVMVVYFQLLACNTFWSIGFGAKGFLLIRYSTWLLLPSHLLFATSHYSSFRLSVHEKMSWSEHHINHSSANKIECAQPAARDLWQNKTEIAGLSSRTLQLDRTTNNTSRSLHRQRYGSFQKSRGPNIGPKQFSKLLL